MENVKQVIVVRKDLHMRMGKVASQCAHASMKVILDQMVDVWPGTNSYAKQLDIDVDSPLDQWLSGLFTKIVVYVNSEEELMNIYNNAIKEEIICSLIEDAGLTEFKGVPTKTCCAIGPDYEEKIDKITGHLNLL